MKRKSVLRDKYQLSSMKSNEVFADTKKNLFLIVKTIIAIIIALFGSKKKNVYYIAELVCTEKEHSDWFPERSEFSYTDR